MTIIRTPDQRLRVFVSSTLQELADERQAARQAIADLRLIPVLFELGARPHPPRNLYRAYLDQSHIFIGIYWQRYGWVAPAMDISGLEDEYRLAGDLPKLIYFKSPAPDRELGLAELIKQIKNQSDVSYKYFSNAEELRDLIADDLAVLLTERFEQARLHTKPHTATAQQDVTHLANLPHPITGLIGREAEVQTLNSLMTDADIRLVTLTGPGGVGKTRLSLEVAASLVDAFDDGIYWVNLAGIHEADLVASAIAQILDVREQSDYPLIESLKDYLQDKYLLLLLDNFEQVITAGPLVSELLASAPGVKALVTSRAGLRLRGEYEFQVPPLEVPKPSISTAMEDMLEIAAVRLFLERAQAAQPNFSLNYENAPIVAEIVRRLDGLPLAIELAAARLKLLSPRLLRDRLDTRLKVLTGGAQDLPPRQQTMRSVINWSYDLLAENNQRLFTRLGIFVGGFTLEAVEAICNPDGEMDVFEGIAALLENSLLSQETSITDQPRFSMLETIHEYALEQLNASGEEDYYRQRHITFFRDLAQEAYPKLFSGESEAWLDRLGAEYGNFRAALEWGQSSAPNSELGWQTIHNLVWLIWLWYRRGYLNEARQWYQKAIEQTSHLGDDLLRGVIIDNAGFVAMWQSDLGAAAQLMDEGLRIIRLSGHSPELAQALFGRGVLAVNQGDAEKAVPILEEALVMYQEVDQKWFQSIILLHLGNMALSRGDLPATQAYYKECHSLGQEVGDPWIIASAINNLGELARYQGDYDQAENYYLESKDLFQGVGSSPDVARADHSLGWVAQSRDDYARAQSLFEGALAFFQQLGVKRGVIECLVGLAAVIGLQGYMEQAAQLYSFSHTQFKILQVGIWPADNAEFERNLGIIRTQLDDITFTNAWDSGKALTLDEALAVIHTAGEK